METNFALQAYIIYLPVVIALTLYVARTLFKNAKIFMMDIFNEREEIALSTNKLFEVGFYLLNIGFAFLIMEITEEVFSAQEMAEILSRKLGGYSIYLGIVLFFNLYLFFRGKRVSRENRMRTQLALNGGNVGEDDPNKY